MTVATVADVAVALGRPISESAEIAQVGYWLSAAELIIQRRLGPVADLDEPAVRYVETEAVVARMRNPEGFQSETIDDYTYRHGTETRQVTISDAWWNLLDPDASGSSASIRPGFEPDATHWAFQSGLQSDYDWGCW